MLGDFLRYAWQGSFSRAGAWAPLPGAIILWLALWLFGWSNVILPTTIPGGIEFFLVCAAAAWVLIFIGRLFYAPIYFLRVARKTLADRIGDTFLVGKDIYVETYWVKWQNNGEETGFYENVFYLQIGNALSDGKVLRRVKARIFFMGEPVLSIAKETGGSEIDIRHGELVLFQIGSIVSNKMYGIIKGGTEIHDPERRKTYEHNVPRGHLSFEIFEHTGKRAYGLHHSEPNPGKFSLLIVVSADDVIARQIPILIDLANAKPVVCS